MKMNEMHEKLTKQLLEVNESLSYAQARTWIEVLCEDFETTRAKAGHSYEGSEMTEKIILSWIKNYGPRLHDFVTSNPKYSHLLNSDDYLKH